MEVKESQDLPITEIKVVSMRRMCTSAKAVNAGNTCRV